MANRISPPMASRMENPLRRSRRASYVAPASNCRPDAPAIGSAEEPSTTRSSSSYAERQAQRQHPSTATYVEGNDVIRNIGRPLPGDVVGRQKPQQHPELNQKRSLYFENEFVAPGRGEDPIKTRIENEAMVVAELNTNAIIRDEFSIITDLSYHLSNRYQRPITSISVSLQHSMCMMFAGNFDRAYTLTIYTLPGLLQPATNKRNAALIQQHLSETLSVTPSRGYIRFVATSEDNVAIGGKTLAAVTENAEKQIRGHEKVGLSRKPSISGRKIIKSVKSLGNFKSISMLDLTRKAPTSPASNSDETTRIETIPEAPATPPEDEKVKPTKDTRNISRTKSIRQSIFSNNSSFKK